jgi:hypothetical protein
MISCCDTRFVKFRVLPDLRESRIYIFLNYKILTLKKYDIPCKAGKKKLANKRSLIMLQLCIFSNAELFLTT